MKYFLYLTTITFFVFMSACTTNEKPVLFGFAKLPADTFADGPTSGQFINSPQSRTAPFVDQQPVQGFSAVLKEPDDSFWVLPDNGFGHQNNSADFVLRVYKIKPDFKTSDGGSGKIIVKSHFSLRDPDNIIGFPIVANMDFYPNGDNNLPVAEEIRSKRLLTGADIDPESFQQIFDGTFYIGDEFGPFLLHIDATGKLLRPPIELPGVKSPQHPFIGNEKANLPRSAGFEGMALNKSGTLLHPMLEKPLTDQPGQLNIYEFDLQTRRYLHTDSYHPPYKYKLNKGAEAVCAFTAISDREFLTIERDHGQGASAQFKKIFFFNFDITDADGFLQKTEVVNLLDIEDLGNLSGYGAGKFDFPFETPEGMLLIDENTIGVVNDNNYPFGLGRYAGTTGEPDDNEFILIRFGESSIIE